MRRALRASPSTTPVAETVTVPAPVGGWNARDSLAAMPIEDAERMLNWFPETTFVKTRPGSEVYLSGYSGLSESLMPYAGATTLELFIAAGTNIYKLGTGGSASANALMMSGRTNARFQHENFSTPGGNFLLAVNGADRPIFYNGTNFSANTLLTASASIVNDFIGVHAYAERLFYIRKDTLDFYYMEATEAIGGTAKRFPLGSVFGLGGSLMSMGTWTRDGGSGMDDAIAFITDQGEVAVYSGTDPGNASNWSKLGVYRIPKPLGRRCTQKYGGDLLVLTEGGVYPMSIVLSGVEPQSVLTDKIRNAFADAVRLYRDNYGWQLLYAPLQHWLIANIPVKEGSLQEQYVMNTNTGAWCRFKGMAANCWANHNNMLFFGQNGAVYQADTGTNDAGTNIEGDVKQAPSNFGYAGFKSFLTIKPFINSDNSVPIAIGMNIDFSDRSPVSVPSPTATTIPHWGTATWSDPYWQWAGRPIPQGSLQSGGGGGIYGAMRMKGAVNVDRLEWMATQITFERGLL